MDRETAVSMADRWVVKKVDARVEKLETLLVAMLAVLSVGELVWKKVENLVDWLADPSVRLLAESRVV